MKIIHCSDLHLDSKIEALSKEKLKIRREEIVRAFERLVDYARSQNVRAIIVAGDTFDTHKISSATQKRLIQLFKKNPNITFLYVSGNHDEGSVFYGEEIENLKIFNEKWSYVRLENVVFTGIDINKAPKQSLYSSLQLNKEDINIVIMHGQIAGYKSKENAELISLPMLKDKNIDYLALGHIHYFTSGNIDERGKYVYSGCLEGRGFDETEEKGFVLIDTESEKFYEFIPFSSRNLYKISFDITDKTNWYEAKEEFMKELKARYDEKSLIEVILKGSCEPDFEIDKEEFLFRLNEMFFYARIKDNTILKIDLEQYKEDKTIIGQFVRSVMASDLTDEIKKKVIKCGLSALNGEEV